MKHAKFMLVATALLLLSVPMARAAEAYRLQPEDVLDISVYGHDDLAREVVVLNDGQFNYPIVGRVDAVGKTPDEVATAITTGLLGELNAPQVTVSIKTPSMRRVYASGLVLKAGSYDLKPGWRLSHLIAEAGGVYTGPSAPARPDLLKATLVRDGKSIPIDIAAVLSASNRDADLELLPRDLLQVQANTNLVHIAGQVKAPGDYQVKDKLGIVEAVAMAGGPTDTAALTRSQIVRGSDVIKVDLYRLLDLGKTDGNIALQPGDTLVIPANESRIAVLGGVQQPGYFDLPDGKSVTVVDALGLAHGPNKRAKLETVALLRTVDGKQEMTKVNVGRFLKKGDATQNPTVQSGDVVYVTDGGNIEPSGILSALTSLAAPVLYTILPRN